MTSWRRRIGLPLALVGMASAWLLVGTSSAVHDPEPFGIDGSSFEVLDGNTVVNNPHGGTPSSLDWNSLNVSSPADTYTATIKIDAESGAGDDSFGNGSKEDTPVPSRVTGSIPPNKSDLKSFGSWIERTEQSQFLHLFWTRVQDPSGTTNMDFEFNKQSCVSGGDVTGCSTNGVTPVRSDRDLLITYDLSRGGTEADIMLRRWDGDLNAWGPATDLSATDATGSINTVGISTGFPGGSYSARTFGEASINMSRIFTSGVCEAFGSAYLKSRSSDSFTSALKDYIAPVGASVSNCGNVVIEKRDDDSPSNAVPGATFALYEDVDLTDASVVGTTSLDGDVTDAQTTLVVADAAKLPAGVGFLIRVDEEWMRVTARTGNLLTVERGAADADGATAAASHDDDVAVDAIGSCTTAGEVTLSGGNKVARCTISGLFYGTYYPVETRQPAGFQPVSDLPPVVVSSTTSPVTVGIVNRRAPASIKITKVTDAGAALPGAVFTLYVDVDDNDLLSSGDTITSYSCTTLHAPTSSSTPKATLAADTGTCTITGIVDPDDYIVHETGVPSGFAAADDQALTVVLGTTYDLASMTGHGAFVDPHLYTVVVLVCRQSDRTLYGSTVSLTPPTPTPVPTAVSPRSSTSLGSSGPTEAELCGANGLASATGTSVYSGKEAGSYTAAVAVPSVQPTP